MNLMNQTVNFTLLSVNITFRNNNYFLFHYQDFNLCIFFLQFINCFLVTYLIGAYYKLYKFVKYDTVSCVHTCNCEEKKSIQFSFKLEHALIR